MTKLDVILFGLFMCGWFSIFSVRPYQRETPHSSDLHQRSLRRPQHHRQSGCLVLTLPNQGTDNDTLRVVCGDTTMMSCYTFDVSRSSPVGASSARTIPSRSFSSASALLRHSAGASSSSRSQRIPWSCGRLPARTRELRRSSMTPHSGPSTGRPKLSSTLKT